MESFHFLRCAVASVSGALLDCHGNAEKICALVKNIQSENVKLISFQELSITGGTCGDMFYNQATLENAKTALLYIATETKDRDTVIMVGLPIAVYNKLYSVMAIIKQGKILALVPLKSALPQFSHPSLEPATVKLQNGDEILFSSAPLLCNVNDLTVSLKFVNFTGDSLLDSPFNGGCEILVCPTCVPSYATSNIKTSLGQYSKQHKALVLFANSGATESSGEHVFLGECAIYENGKCLNYSNIFNQNETSKSINFSFSPVAISDCDIELVANLKRKTKAFHWHKAHTPLVEITFKSENPKVENLYYPVEPHPYLPNFEKDATSKDEFFKSLLDYSAFALARRLKAIGTDKMLLGISGGVDSTFALLVCVRSLILQGKKANTITAITMPCFATTNRTKSNALSLAEVLNCSFETIDITKTVLSHFDDIQHNQDTYNTTFENAQARERTQVLLDKANQLGGIVVSASDLSEIALGWSTFAGDHISQYNVTASLPKTVLRKALEYYASTPELFTTTDANKFSTILHDILDTPVSPELVPSGDKTTITQKTEDILGSYEVHDFILWHFVKHGFTKQKILFLLEKAFCQTYTRDELSACVELFFKRFFSNQFKRSCSPEGASILPLSLSPRGSYNLSSDIGSSFFENFFTKG